MNMPNNMLEVQDTDGVRYSIPSERAEEFKDYVAWLDNCTGQAWAGFPFERFKIGS